MYVLFCIYIFNKRKSFNNSYNDNQFVYYLCGLDRNFKKITNPKKYL